MGVWGYLHILIPHTFKDIFTKGTVGGSAKWHFALQL